MTRRQTATHAAILLLGLPFDRSSAGDVAAGADAFFDEGRYAEALALYDAAAASPGRIGDVHLAYHIHRLFTLRRAECLDRLHRWDEAARTYLRLTDNTQPGTHFARCLEAPYRLVAMYQQAGSSQKLSALISDYEDTIRFSRRLDRASSHETDEQALNRSGVGFIEGLLADTNVPPPEVATFLASLPVVTNGTPLPTAFVCTDLQISYGMSNNVVRVPGHSAFRYLFQKTTKLNSSEVATGRRLVEAAWSRRSLSAPIAVEERSPNDLVSLIWNTRSNCTFRVSSREYHFRELRFRYDPEDVYHQVAFVVSNSAVSIDLYLVKQDWDNLCNKPDQATGTPSPDQ